MSDESKKTDQTPDAADSIAAQATSPLSATLGVLGLEKLSTTAPKAMAEDDAATIAGRFVREGEQRVKNAANGRGK